MADAFIVRRGGGGGAGLNFSVVGGTTQPTGKENLIWVNTSTAITSWEFSATQPTSPTAGMVWFVTGTSSSTPINALKKNGIWIYPTGVSQYVSGEWITKNAKVYQNGSWKDWSKYIILSGVEAVSNSLQASAKKVSYGADHYSRIPTITNRNSEFTVSMTGVSNLYISSGSVISAEDIDFSPYSKLILNASAKTAVTSEKVYISIFNRANNEVVQGSVVSAEKSITAVGNFTLELNIPAGTGSYALAFAISSWAGQPATVTITDFYLTP